MSPPAPPSIPERLDELERRIARLEHVLRDSLELDMRETPPGEDRFEPYRPELEP